VGGSRGRFAERVLPKREGEAFAVIDLEGESIRREW